MANTGKGHDIEESDTNEALKSRNNKDNTVLLVDDNEMHNMALKKLLNYSVSNCITAPSAKAAFEALQEHRIDCIVLDMYLPDADGYEVMKTIKKQKNYEDLPIIVYSGKSISQKEEEELRQFADEIIYKNVDSYKVLSNKLSSILN